jgi:hypothetical protein
MKIKIQFGKAARFVVPNKKIMRAQIPCPPLNWLDLRKLALAERTRSCRHGTE